ncbi:hypothetical protein CAEBREN_15691 [Caenorhabditis brenneri]|uniref:Uncharacterized protein n=1 Tax=Caenorhabditis brenneri TaxID=135651 RepID=G0MJ98_CAEBE|nr:hypothetical protein CAEBREN_15691 [Caenorhabditis brenneri]
MADPNVPQQQEPAAVDATPTAPVVETRKRKMEEEEKSSDVSKTSKKEPSEKEPEPAVPQLVIGAPYPTVEELFPIPHDDYCEWLFDYLSKIHCGNNWQGEMRQKYGHEAYEMWKNSDWKMDDEWYAQHVEKEWNFRLARGQAVDFDAEEKKLNFNLKMRNNEHDAIRQEWEWLSEVRHQKGDYEILTPEEVQKNCEEITKLVDGGLREEEKRLRPMRRRGIETRSNPKPWSMYPLGNGPKIRIPLSVKNAKKARRDARKALGLPETPYRKALHIPLPTDGRCLECEPSLYRNRRDR